VNALWDFTCAASIFANFPLFSTAHTHLWKHEEDKAATRLMAYLVFCWGCMRLAAALWARREIALFSYVFEALVFACEARLYGTMHYWKATAVSLASLALALWALFEM
jgi:hypothetical protein